jgi:hypothetical protein
MYSITQNQPGYWTVFIRFPYARSMQSTAAVGSREHLDMVQSEGGF